MADYSSLRLKMETHLAIKAIAAREGKTMTRFFKDFVAEYEEKHKQGMKAKHYADK